MRKKRTRRRLKKKSKKRRKRRKKRTARRPKNKVLKKKGLYKISFVRKVSVFSTQGLKCSNQRAFK